MAGLGQREQSLEARVERLELELELQGKRLSEAQAARDLADGRVAAVRREVEELERALEKTRVALTDRLVGLYRLGRESHLRLLLSAEPGDGAGEAGGERGGAESSSGGGRVLPAVRWLRYLARRDAQAVDRYTEARGELREERRRLAREQAELEEWVGQEALRRRTLAATRDRQARLLAELRSERLAAAARAESLAEKERKLATLIETLAPGGDGIDSALPGSSERPILEFQGVLDWPMDGEVREGFGPRLDPRYRTRTPHNGLELVPSAEGIAVVRSVYPGRVLYADRFEGYGPTVIVHHPGRVFTLYAGLDSLRVASGDMLELGQPVGVVTERLYFEIRRDNRPEDPEGWLR